MTFHYTYKSESCSVITREASLKIYENKYKDPELDNMQRVRNLGTLCPKWVVFIKPLPSGGRELCNKGGIKILRARNDRCYQGNNILQTQQDQCNMNIQRE